MSKWDTETANWYAEKYGEYATNRLGIEALDLEARFTVVDVGCGTGSALRHASLQVTEGSLIGIDPVPRMIEIAREKTVDHPAAARINYKEGSAENLPLVDASADVVLAFDSFDHWVDQTRGLQEVRRILKPGGRLVVVKDGGLPARDQAKTVFLQILQKAGFRVLSENSVDEGDISFTQWICLASI